MTICHYPNMLKHFDKVSLDKNLFFSKIGFSKNLKFLKTNCQKHVSYKTKLEIELEIVFEAINQTEVCVSDNPINLLLSSSFDKKSKRKVKIQNLGFSIVLILPWSFLQKLVPEAF